jgi:hypothetical protein
LKNNGTILRVCGTLLCLGVVTQATSALATFEVVTHAVNQYAQTNGAAYCCAGCAELANPTGDANVFLTGGQFSSNYNQVQQWTNRDVDGRDWVDPAQFAWGADNNDPQGTDFADVIFYSGHGDYGSAAQESHIFVGDNNAGETCAPRVSDDTPAQRHMAFGLDADAFVTFACNTAQHEVWELGGYNALSQAGSQFNMLNGFHGVVWEVSGYQTAIQNYAADAIYDGMGDAWIDRMYTNRPGAEDNCPVPTNWGANVSETDDYYNNAGWLDLRDTGARSGTLPRIHYVCGCDPQTGEALPAC